MSKPLTRNNILKELGSRENTSIIYDIICDIFEKKSNFNLDRNIGKKQVYTLIHKKANENFSSFIVTLLKKGGDVINVITYLNKTIVQDVTILLSRQESYKNFINAISTKPKDNQLNPNVIQRDKPSVLESLAPPVNRKIVPTKKMNDIASNLQLQRYAQEKRESPDFTEPMADEKINLEYAMDVYKKQRDQPLDEVVTNKSGGVPEELELGINDLESVLFGGANRDTEELPYQSRETEITNDENIHADNTPQEYTDGEYEEEQNREIHHEPSLGEYIDETIYRLQSDLERLFIIKEYIKELNI